MATVTCTETGEDWTCSFGDMLADKQTHRQTDVLDESLSARSIFRDAS